MSLQDSLKSRGGLIEGFEAKKLKKECNPLNLGSFADFVLQAHRHLGPRLSSAM